EEDQRIRRAFADAGDGALARHRLRQGLEDRPPRHGQRSHAEGSRVATRLRHGGGIRSRRGSEKNGEALRGDRCINQGAALNIAMSAVGRGSRGSPRLANELAAFECADCEKLTRRRRSVPTLFSPLPASFTSTVKPPSRP